MTQAKQQQKKRSHYFYLMNHCSPPRLCVITSCSFSAGILKKKQLSPIVERNGLNRIHNELCENAPGTASPQGSISSNGRVGLAKTSLPDQLNGVAMSIKAGTVDGDSSGSEWVVTQAETNKVGESSKSNISIKNKKPVSSTCYCVRCSVA